MKYLKRFSSVSDANAQGAEGLYSPHTDVVSGTSAVNFATVSTDKFTCGFDNNGYIINVSPVIAGHNVGDICYWDGSKLAYIPYTSWESSLGIALGVCYIPTSHAKAWGDGKARFLSVSGVNSDGTAATSEQYLVWDSSAADAGLTKYTKVPTWDNTVGGSVGSNSYGYISSDRFSSGGTQNVVDTSSYYNSEANVLIPSPYAANGSFNTAYNTIIEGNNALSDFNGKTNTTTIVTALGASGGEAAKACSLYSTNGIAAGEWYLPALGEWAYIMPRFNTIQAALTAVSGVALRTGDDYWSSSEYSASRAYVLGTGRGRVYFVNKYFACYIRPSVSLS